MERTGTNKTRFTDMLSCLKHSGWLKNWISPSVANLENILHSRVVITSKLFIFTTLESKFTSVETL